MVSLSESDLEIRQDYETNSNYNKRTFNQDRYHLYWKLSGEEIEIVLQVQTHSWVGIGWRPQSFGPHCRFPFPYYAARPQVDSNYEKFVDAQKGKPLQVSVHTLVW